MAKKDTATPVAAKKAAPAAKKATSTAVAVAKPRGGNVSTISASEIRAKLQAQAAGMSDRTAPPSGIKIQVTQDKKFKLPNGETVTELLAVVADFRTQHNFYEGEFDPKNIVPPVCFAVGTNPRQMAPVDDSPQLQAENCQVCPQNQFGSATKGDGKACKNGRILGLLPPNEDGTGVDAEADIWLLGVSPTALRAWDGYVQGLVRQHQLPPSAFLTTITFNDAVTYAQLAFSDPILLSDEDIAAVQERVEEAGELCERKPDWSGMNEEGQQTPKAKVKGKPAPARNVAPSAPARKGGGMGARR